MDNVNVFEIRLFVTLSSTTAYLRVRNEGLKLLALFLVLTDERCDCYGVIQNLKPMRKCLCSAEVTRKQRKA
jgi:hypothetical protein